MRLRVSAKKVRLAKGLMGLFFLMAIGGAIAGIVTGSETALIALCLAAIVPVLASSAIVDSLFRCPRCRGQLQRTDVSRLHLVLHPDVLPRFCQKCGWEVQTEQTD